MDKRKIPRADARGIDSWQSVSQKSVQAIINNRG